MITAENQENMASSQNFAEYNMYVAKLPLYYKLVLIEESAHQFFVDKIFLCPVYSFINP